MAFVSSFIYCDNLQQNATDSGIQTTPVNPIQVLLPVSIPGNYSFAIACNISDIDPKKDKSVSILFIDPDGKAVSPELNAKIDFPAEMTSQNDDCNLQLTLDLRNVIFMKEGIYSTVVKVGAKKIGEYRIRVKKGLIKQ